MKTSGYRRVFPLFNHFEMYCTFANICHIQKLIGNILYIYSLLVLIWEKEMQWRQKVDRIMPNACKYFIKIVYDGQGALIAVSLIINLEFVMFYYFNHSPLNIENYEI